MIRNAARPFAVAVAMLSVACSAREDSSELRLATVEASRLPSEFAIAGVTRGRNGRIAAFESQGTRLAVRSRDAEWTTVTLPGTAITGIRPDDGGAWEAVTSGPAALVAVGATGTIGTVRALELEGQIAEAHHDGERWWFASVDRTGDYAVWGLRDDGRPWRAFTVAARDSVERNTTHWMRLSASSDGLYLTRRSAPYSVLFLGRASLDAATKRATRVERADFVREAVEVPVLDQRHWVSLPAYALAGGYIQTLSDVRTDERILLVVSKRGTRVRTTRVRAPMGIAGSDLSDSTVLAIRTIDVAELVVYRASRD